MKTAILVDGGFFIKRYRTLYKGWQNHSPQKVANELIKALMNNLEIINSKNGTKELYRIFYYDCPPLTKRIQNPITKKGITLEKTKESIFRTAFFDELKRKRKVALRFGRISDNGHWSINSKKTKELINKKISIDDLQENDVIYSAIQKGVDMKIGLDIASLSYKKAVDQIILIAGDSDFVPAAKLARREGIDFILDPMWNNVNPDLFEHIDGMSSKCWNKPKSRNQ